MLRRATFFISYSFVLTIICSPAIAQQRDLHCAGEIALPTSLPPFKLQPGKERISPIVIDVPDTEPAGPRVALCPYRQATVEVILLADYTAAYGVEGAYTRIISLMDQVNTRYRSSVSINLRLLRIHVFVGTDPMTPSTDALTLLNSVSSWRQANISTLGLGTVVGMTARDLDGSVVGAGYTNSMCNIASACVQEDRPGGCNNSGTVSTLIAHQIGHNFNISHDASGNACTTNGFIMQASMACGASYTQFSSCSATYLSAFLSSPSATCVANMPPLPRGDLNCDCNITTADIDPFVLGLIDPVAYQGLYPSCPLAEQGDLNNDALVDGGDIPLFVDAVTP